MQRENLFDLLIVVMTFAMVFTVVFIEYRAGYAAGFNKFSSLTQMQPPVKTTFITGKITSTFGAMFTIQTSAQPFAPGSTIQSATKQIVTDAATVFERVVPKDQKTYQSEIAALTKKAKPTPTGGVQAPMEYTIPPITFETISLTELRSGDNVSVTVTEDNRATRVIVAPTSSIGSGTASSS